MIIPICFGILPKTFLLISLLIQTCFFLIDKHTYLIFYHISRLLACFLSIRSYLHKMFTYPLIDVSAFHEPVSIRITSVQGSKQKSLAYFIQTFPALMAFNGTVSVSAIYCLNSRLINNTGFFCFNQCRFCGSFCYNTLNS